MDMLEVIDDVKECMEMYPPAEIKLIVRCIKTQAKLIKACHRAISALTANGAPNCEAVKELKSALAEAEA